MQSDTWDAFAERAWIDKGEAGINCHLQQQAEIAFDADTRDRWNRDVERFLDGELVGR